MGVFVVVIVITGVAGFVLMLGFGVVLVGVCLLVGVVRVFGFVGMGGDFFG